MGKLQRHNYTLQTRAKRPALSQHVTARHKKTDVHESLCVDSLRAEQTALSM